MDYTNIKEKMEKCISVYSEKLSEVATMGYEHIKRN